MINISFLCCAAQRRKTTVGGQGGPAAPCDVPLTGCLLPSRDGVLFLGAPHASESVLLASVSDPRPCFSLLNSASPITSRRS